MKNLADVRVVKQILADSGFKFSKSLGQNFLIDENVLDKMIENGGINKTVNVLEIGPGFGTLTQKLCINAKKVVSVEIDSTVIPILAKNTEEFDNLKIINADVMKTDLKKLLNEEFGDESVKVVANLPYYITTPIIMMLLENELKVDDIIIMIQKEVADRISAKPCTKDYGALTVAVNFYSVAEVIVNVPPSAFIPQPKVSSSVIRLAVRSEPPVNVKNKKNYFKVVKASFGQRRKTLLNALSNSGITNKPKDELSALLEGVDISGQRRGETLTLEEFAIVADTIFE